MTTATEPAWRPYYPFTGKHFEVAGGHKMHYLDLGEGPPVLMLHGNPSWSIYYRELAQALQGTHRVIVPDHIGCGLSDKPGDDYPYTLSRRVEDLEALLASLGIDRNITLVLHDWGGMIGMALAHKMPAAIARLVVFNTAAFPLPAAKALPWPLRLARDAAAGEWLVRNLNAFAVGTSIIGCKRKPMSAALRRAYTAPYDTPANRIATIRFVQDIPLAPGDRAFDLMTAAAHDLTLFRDRPVFIGWGPLDLVFDRHFLAEWRTRFPDAEVHVVEDAGHYILEDAGDLLIPKVQDFLARTEAGRP